MANTFFGSQAGIFNTTGSFNTIVGRFAGGYNNADANAFFGAGAGEQNTTGSDNTFVGTSAGAANVTGINNSFFGRDAGRNNTVAVEGSFFGRSAGFHNIDGSFNSFFGFDAGQGNTNGFGNAFFGHGSGFTNTSGFNNTFVGAGAGKLNVGGSQNAFFGDEAGYNNTASDNSFFGAGAGYANLIGSDNSFFGRETGLNNTGSGNSFFGRSAGITNTIGIENTIIGANANVGLPNLINATAIGFGALVSTSNALVLGNSNTSVGIGTSTPSSKLTVVGLIETTTGGVKFPDGTIQTTAGAGGVTSLNGLTNNVTLAAGSNISITPSGNTLTIASTTPAAILNQSAQQTGANFNIDGTGIATVFNATTQYNLGGPRVLGAPGQNNLFVGIGAGAVPPVLGDDNIENTFFGRSSGQNNIDCCNAFFGNYSGQSNTTGGGNTFLGYQAGTRNTQGSNNTFVGINSGNWFNTGDGNTFVGDAAGNGTASGLNITLVGRGANVSANNLSFATAIGADSVVDASNTIVIGKTALGPYPADTVRIPGDLVVTGALSTPSDARLKTGISNLRYGLDEVMRLRPVTWKWKNDSVDRTRLGLIAQEVQLVVPELVMQGTDKDRLLSMNYLGLLPVVIKAIQEQEATIASLRNEIAALQNPNTRPINKNPARPHDESTVMMRVYQGVATLNRQGEAVVTLPDQFESLNQGFHYQLTCIGGFASVYIADEIEGNHFKIAGGKSGMRVSWQVTSR